MKWPSRTSQVSAALLAGSLWLLSGCSGGGTNAEAASGPMRRSSTLNVIPSGTVIKIALGTSLTTRTAEVGEEWSGTVTENVRTRNDAAIPPGSEVEGMVTGVTRAAPGARAMLELGVRTIRVNGHDEDIVASADPVYARSVRVRAPGEDEAVNADFVDSVSVGGVAAESRGHQVVLFDGSVMTFKVTQTVAIR